MSPEIAAIIQRSLDSIEEGLTGALTPEQLSREAGFSLYHYCRVFKAATGMSVMRYITRRRLMHAVYHMGLGGQMTDCALSFGFDSYAGFYKAFRREFSMSPTGYLKEHQAVRPARVNLKERGNIMEQKHLDAALAAWELSGAATQAVRYPGTGNVSTNTWLVDDRYYLKGSESPGALQRQAQLLRALHRQQLAAEVIPAKNGEDVVRTGDWECLLTGRIQGETLRARELLSSPGQGEAVGEGLARLHQALLTMDPLLCREEDFSSTLRHWAVPKVKEAVPELSLWLDSWLARFCSLYPALPVQIIHRDPNPDNILMRQGRVAGFVDFDLSCIACRLFDVAYVCTGALSVAFERASHQERMGFFQLVEAVRRGYHQHSPLSSEELEALPDMIIAIQLICVAAFAGTDTYAHLAEVNRKMLEMILENENLLRQSLS